MKRTVVKITGASGMGLLSVGDIISKTLKNLGYSVCADREYPSLIKGGHSSYQIDFSTEELRSLSSKTDILIALDAPGIVNYVKDIKENGIIIHGHEHHEMIGPLLTATKDLELTPLYLPAQDIAFSFGGNHLMVNMVLLGLLWKVLGLEMAPLIKEVEERFATKPKLLEIDLKCLQAGYEGQDIENIPTLQIPSNKEVPKKILINGNNAIGLGAIQAGVRAYYAYPMSPASTILTYLAKTYKESGMVVKQAEDEITSAQMALGSMYTGTRALVATSGGGFDLMTETVSLAAMTETPLVIVIAQRPGPATGLPTWTGQADLNMAIHSGHGEYAKAVISCSDPTSAYEQVQYAMNIAEKFQIPVILLTEKVIAEAQITVDHFEHGKIPIERGLVTSEEELAELRPSDRYKITESGLSKRWIPGSCKAVYCANGDEHWESGSLTEDAEKAAPMIEKRIIKEKLVKEYFPDPEIYGVESGADISFVGWGSSKNAVLDAMKNAEEQGLKVNYLHYEYLWPFKEEKAKKFFADNPNVCLIEGNYRGQLGEIIENNTGNKFAAKFLKYDGRAFCHDEVTAFINENK